MELSIDLRPVLGPALVRLDAMRIKQIHPSLAQPPSCSSRNAAVYAAIDELAALSSQAANIRQPLTTCEKLVQSDHVLYLSWQYNEETKKSVMIGYAKVGRKNLFLNDEQQKTYEGTMMCLLDFYVHYTEQRKGHGQDIFNHILQTEKLKPFQIALDNPTVTLLGFMNQKYKLERPIWQNTNFVVFPEMFRSLDVNGENVEKAPDGWWRPATPRRLGSGSADTRWLGQAISGHNAKGHAMANPVDGDQTTEGTLANRANQARARKAHILSSKPLW